MKRVIPAAILAIAATAVLAWAGLAGARPSHSTVATVKVTATEFKFALTPRTGRLGTDVFVVRNAGKLPHDFKIFGRKTPLIAPGKTAKLTVKFIRGGRFAFLCTVPGHAKAGMKGVLVVR